MALVQGSTLCGLCRRGEAVVDLYNHLLQSHERVICTDEHNSLRPCPRLHTTRAVEKDGISFIYMKINPQAGKQFKCRKPLKK